jgi:hypothetical protein
MVEIKGPGKTSHGVNNLMILVAAIILCIFIGNYNFEVYEIKTNLKTNLSEILRQMYLITEITIPRFS